MLLRLNFNFTFQPQCPGGKLSMPGMYLPPKHPTIAIAQNTIQNGRLIVEKVYSL